MGHDLGRRAGGGVPADHHLATGARRAHHLLRRDRAVRAGHRLAPLEAPEVRPGRHPELARAGVVEAARALLLDQRVPVRAGAVLDGEGGDRVAVAAQGLGGLELDQAQLERRAADHRAQGLEQPPQAGRPVDGERGLAPAQGEGLEHARQAQEVVGVEVGEEHLLEVHQADRAQELALRALAAVEEQALAPAAHEQRGQGATGGRRRAGGADEENLEVHGPILARRADGSIDGPAPSTSRARSAMASSRRASACSSAGPSSSRSRPSR